jgi:hypothetical protein
MVTVGIPIGVGVAVAVLVAVAVAVAVLVDVAVAVGVAVAVAVGLAVAVAVAVAVGVAVCVGVAVMVAVAVAVAVAVGVLVGVGDALKLNWTCVAPQQSAGERVQLVDWPVPVLLNKYAGNSVGVFPLPISVNSVNPFDGVPCVELWIPVNAAREMASATDVDGL